MAARPAQAHEHELSKGLYGGQWVGYTARGAAEKLITSFVCCFPRLSMGGITIAVGSRCKNV